MVALTQVKRNPGINKSNIYSGPYEKENLDLMLRNDLLVMEVRGSRRTSVRITEKGEELLSLLRSIADEFLDPGAVDEYIDARIEHNDKTFERRFLYAKVAVYESRGQIAPKVGKKRPTPPEFSTKGLNIKNMRLEGDEYVVDDE